MGKWVCGFNRRHRGGGSDLSPYECMWRYAVLSNNDNGITQQEMTWLYQG